ncbi:MAG: hypothetical protein KatS3mg102_2557 [Planctomycetota bacterium]|nr:MAG: hypothetical protein KatS3mg102_2557 [Planctomycetota bacterium]
MGHAMRGQGYGRGLAPVLLAVLAAGMLGCRDQSQGKFAASSEIVGGRGAAEGPDAVAGSGGPSADLGEVPPAPGPAIASDFVLTNGRIIAHLDAVGLDPTFTVPGSFTGGVPLQNTLAPSGGNLVDLGLVGRDNDQFVTNGLIVLGVNEQGVPNTETATANVVYNFAIIPDTDSSGLYTALTGLPARTPGARGSRRAVVVGVILNTSGNGRLPGGGQGPLPEPISGTATFARAEVTALGGSAQLGPGLATLFDNNIPDAFPLLVDASLLGATNVPVPLLVVTIYTATAHGPNLTVATVIANQGLEPIGVTNLVEAVGTGALDNKNLDVVMGGPMFVPDPSSGNFVPATALAPGGNLGLGAPRWVSFIGRDEPPVSYTFVDALAGNVIVRREDGSVTQLIQLRSDPDIPAEGRLEWVRHWFVGDANDGASSSDLAARTLALSPVRAGLGGRPAFGLGGPPNAVTDTVVVEGRVRNAPPGTVVRISEVDPTFFAPLTPGTPDLTPGVFGPAPSLGSVPLGAVPVTTVRVGPHGNWRAELPAGFLLQTAAGLIDVPFSQYRFEVFAPGTLIKLDTTPPTAVSAAYVDPADGDTTFTIARGARPLHIGALDAVAELGLGTLSYEIRDGDGALIPGTLRIFRLSDPPTEIVDLGVPTGLEESWERAAAAGFTAYTATGRGEVVLPAGSYTVIANRGIEYELDVRSPLSGNAVVIAGGSVTSESFTLERVAGAGTGALGGDFHVHTGFSPDSAVPPADRLVTFLAQGLEILASSDHDNLRGFEQARRELRREQPALEQMLHIMPGIEVSTDLGFGPIPQGVGHYNVYPASPQPGTRKGGAPEDEFRPSAALQAQMRLLDGDFGNGAEIVQLNHPHAPFDPNPPLGGSDGYLTNLDGIDASRNAAAAVGGTFVPLDRVGTAILLKGEPLVSTGISDLVAVGTLLAGSLGFDTMELANGNQDGRRFKQNRQAWFQMLNVGIARTAMGTSDMHRVDPRVGLPRFGETGIGVPRTYLLLGENTTAGSVTDAEIVAALKPSLATPDVTATPNAAGGFNLTFSAPAPLEQAGMRAIVTTGPFLQVRVQADSSPPLDEGDPVGRFLTASNANTITVTVDVVAPSWIMEHFVALPGSSVTPRSIVKVHMNGQTVTGTASLVNPADPTRARAVFTLAAPSGVDAWIAVEAGQPDEDLAELGFDPVTGVLSVIEGSPPGGVYNLVYHSLQPLLSLTNPIFFDLNGDGVFDAPEAGD